jgi:hypothetical protein
METILFVLSPIIYPILWFCSPKFRQDLRDEKWAYDNLPGYED